MKKFCLRKNARPGKRARKAAAALFLFFALAISHAPAQGGALQAFSRAVLPNGMTIFVCEDFSSPTVRVEYSAKAGFSSQSAQTAGYAPLYASLFLGAGRHSPPENGEWLLSAASWECAADSARYAIEADASQAEEIFREFSLCAFAPIFSDQELDKKLRAAKDEAAKNAFSAEGFINGAIDSRVFYAAPWKHDSGIYPALFQKQGLSEARSILAEMSKRFYSPQNSALFVAGALQKDDAIFLAEKTFGAFPPSSVYPQKEEAAGSAPARKKFVLSDPELSPDMEQAVFEYAGLSMEQADIASAILSSRLSRLKAALSGNPALNIRGADYINADAAHKGGTSRLIIQALLEKSGQNYFEQALLFEKTLKQTIFDFSKEEFEAAQRILVLDFERASGSPRGFMELLSQFWAVDGIAKKSFDKSGERGDAESLVERFLARPQKIMAEDFSELRFALEQEEPFVFFLLNSKSFSPLASAFENAGFESVTAKNASWHSQALFSQIRESIEKTEEGGPRPAGEAAGEAFVQKNLQGAKSAALSNAIPVYVKISEQNAASAVGLYIKGGEAQSAESEPGLEEVTVSLLALNARKAAAKKVADGSMRFAAVSSETGAISALVTIECLSGDEGAALECLAEALFFGEIIPSDADIFASGKKSERIIKNASMAGQLYSFAARLFYKTGLCRALYSQKSGVLDGVQYTAYLESYARLLDAARLSILAAGNISFDEFAKKAQELFGGLNSARKEQEPLQEARLPSKTSQRVKMRRTFLTDVSADKAGPRPAVLVPTTDFADPAQYWFLRNGGQDCEPLFDALLYELASVCQEIIRSKERYQKMTVRVEENNPLMPFGALTFFNVQYVSDADAILQEALERLKKEAADGEAVKKIKSLWIKTAFDGADKSAAALSLAAKKIDRARVQRRPFDFAAETVQDYKIVSAADEAAFLRAAQDFEKFYKFYSADAKR